MNTRTNILTKQTFCTTILLLVMTLGGGMKAWANDNNEEKVLYYTEFQDWSQLSSTKTETKIEKTTSFSNETLTFSLMETTVSPTGTYKDGTNSCITPGYLMAAKTATPYIKTSGLKHVTRVKFVHGSTGSKRGWGLKVKGDGDTDWVTLSTSYARYGEEVTVDVNRKNVQLWFYNLSTNQNAYMTSLEIFGTVEAAEEVNVSYYDTDGTTLIGKETVKGKTKLSYKYGVKDITLGSGNVFRGWFTGTGDNDTKVTEGTELLSDINLYAKATPKEFATNGSEYSYDLTKQGWYPEDHELIDIRGGAYADRVHGWKFENAGTISLQVANQAQISLTLCGQSNGGTIFVTDKNDKEITTFQAKATTDGAALTFLYDGGVPTTLTFNLPSGTYIHNLSLLNYKPVYVSFKFPIDKIEGECPETIKADGNNEVTMPENVLFTREGWTFMGWTDGTYVYEGGKKYAIQESVTLTPKMVENRLSIADANSPISVTWPFDYRKAPVISMNSKGKTSLIYNKVTAVEGDKQDIAMKIDATVGKLENTDGRINALNNGAEGAQVNDGTTFTIPAIYGMTIQIHASDKVDNENANTTTHFGTADNDSKVELVGYAIPDTDMSISDNGKTLSIIYKGDATQVTINAKSTGTTKNWGFYKDITAIYPVLPTAIGENVIEQTEATVQFPNEKAENAGTIHIQSSTANANTGSRFKIGDIVTISATPSYGYQLKGYRVKGTEQLLTNKQLTDENGNKVLAADFTITDGTTIIEAIYTHLPLYKVTIKSTDASQGTVSLSPKYDNFYHQTDEKGGQVECWYTEGTQVTATVEAAEEYVVEKWFTEESETAITEANYHSFTIGNAAQTYIVKLRQGEIGSVKFDISNAHVNGKTAAYKDAQSMPIGDINKVRSFTIPTNYTFFKNVDDNDVATENNYTLSYWIDKDDNNNRYDLGKTYSFKTAKTIILTPVFEYNPSTQTNRLNNPVIRYDFGRKVHIFYDPTSKETRKVCAQAVNITNNQKVFWTSKVYVEILQNGQTLPHSRDVTMWCDTGNNGYIRNTELEDWCSFGPGTTFWCASGAGTKISIMTYSKITSTTIDGVVPTLDEVRTAEERQKAGSDHLYVYSYTTHNPALRLPIVIGDDYSYYQWIELATLAANMVNLHTKVDDEQHGKVTSITSLSEHKAEELEDGGHALNQGDRVKITMERAFGYELDKIVDPTKTDNQGEPLAVLKIRDDGKVDMVDFEDASTVHSVNRNEDGSWGIADGDNKTVFVLTQKEPTEEEAKNGKHTQYDIEFAITTHRNLEIYFKEKPTYYITYSAGQFAAGTPPVSQWVEAGDKYAIPQNTTLYYEGNTLDHWVDEGYEENMNDEDKEKHTYRIGQEYVATAQDIRLSPVFLANSFNILDLEQATTATWHFTRKDGAPTINYEKTAGILVTQLENNGKKIDLKLELDGTNGKFNNESNPERIQINEKSVFSFPATPLCVAKLTAISDPSTTWIAGKKKGDEGYHYTEGTNAIEVVCAGDSAYHKTIFTTASSVYCVDFMVTYNVQDKANKSSIETLTCDKMTLDAKSISEQMATKGYITFTVSPWKNEEEKIPTITGTATMGGYVTSSSATVLSPEAIATVKTAGGITVETYPIRFEFNQPEDFPLFEKLTINGTEYTAPEVDIANVPQSGIIKIAFNRTMTETAISQGVSAIDSHANAGKELSFKYWDLPAGQSITLKISPSSNLLKDIYGKTCQQELVLTLHIMKEQDRYQHHTFDFIVGEDGNMDEAIEAANNSSKADGERYYIFVPNGEYQLTGNEYIDYLKSTNALTKISRSSVSLIGQSKEGVTIWNKPTTEGISWTGTIHIGKGVNDFYAQDLTLDNRLDYWNIIGSGAARAAAFWDQGNRCVLKNVSLESWQDTYYSNNASAGYRSYFENCDISGVVDFLCGDGDIWFEKCNLILRERTGNNIAAPATQKEQDWGYVFNNCTIKPEAENPQLVKDYDWTIARPWNESPACTFLNTKMAILPDPVGWGRMMTSKVLRMHEYRSMNGDGSVLLSLGTRSLTASAPAAGSDECVLNKAQADKYTIRNAMGGTDAFEPNVLCRQIDAASGITSSAEDLVDPDDRLADTANHTIWQDNIVLDDDVLQWDPDNKALCYFLFKQDENGKWIYKANTAENQISLTAYGSGYYCVRAANQRGGLGAATEAVQFVLTDPYVLNIKQTGELTGDGGKPYGWTTICLPFNAKVPEGIKVYAATAHDKTSDVDKVKDYLMTLTPVNVIDAEKGYVVYGPAGEHSFMATSRNCDQTTILTGNPTDEAISTVNKDGYVLANRTWGLGFYKFAGSTYAPYRAWLPINMVTDNVQEGLATSTQSIRFYFADDTTGIHLPQQSDGTGDDAYYNLSGQKVNTPTRPGIYISRNKGKMIKK